MVHNRRHAVLVDGVTTLISLKNQALIMCKFLWAFEQIIERSVGIWEVFHLRVHMDAI